MRPDRSTVMLPILLLAVFLAPNEVRAQVVGGSSDRTQQELALLPYTTGIRIAYCQQTPLLELVEPFKEAIARMVNRFCRNPAPCGLKKT